MDRTSLVAGLAISVAGVVLLLDRTGAIDLRFGYAAPLVIAVVGAILLAAGLEGREEPPPARSDHPVEAPRDDG